MGAYYPGIPENLAIFLNEKHNAKYFVETGTYIGSTASWASNFFKKVVTIDISEELYAQTKKKYKDIQNIQFLFGNSVDLLTGIITQLNSILIDDEKILFWLDAHYSGGITGGKNIKCPLLKELELILTLNFNSIILIDDARFILCPSPEKNTISAMPSYDEVLNVLNFHNKRYTFIWRDIVVSIPFTMAESVYSFLQPIVGKQGIFFLDEYIDKFLSNMSFNEYIKALRLGLKRIFRKILLIFHFLRKKK